MSSSKDLFDQIIISFKNNTFAQVKGYNRFGYIRETPKAVLVSREDGQDTRIPYDKLVKAINAVKKDPSVYEAGPSSLINHGITHVNSPIWALLHLLPKESYRD